MKRIIPRVQGLVPRIPASASVKLTRMSVAYGVALAPVGLGSAVVYVFASHHLISYWWLALTLGWAIVPLAILVRAVRYARRADAQARQVTPPRPAAPGY